MCGRNAAPRLSAAEQRNVGSAWIAGAARLLVDGDERVLGMYDGSLVDVASAGRADVHTAALGADRRLRRPGRDSALSAPTVGAVTSLCSGTTGFRDRFCGRDFSPIREPHWLLPPTLRTHTARVLEMRWQRRGATGGLEFDNPLDLSGATHLDLRTIVDPRNDLVRLGVRLFDGNDSQVLTPRQDGVLRGLPGSDPIGKVWAQTLRVALGGARDVDLSHVTRVDLVARSERGRVWVLDIAGRAPGLVAVPARRLPTVRLGDVRHPEGDRGQRTMNVPFTVRGTVTQPSRFVVQTFNTNEGGVVGPTVVRLAPGDTSGVIPISYAADQRDDHRLQVYLAAAFVNRGVLTARSTALARLVDDDPAPAVTVTRVSRRVSEGDAAQWRLTLDRPVDYPLGVRGRVVFGDVSGQRLRVGDVPRRWVRRHLFRVPAADKTLAAVGTRLFGFIREGRRTETMSIPVRRDGTPERLESVTLRMGAAGPGFADAVDRTVRVADAAGS